MGYLEVAFSPDGRYVTASTGVYDSKNAACHVWDVATAQEVARLRLPEGGFPVGSRFTADGRLLTATAKGVVAWDVTTGDHEVLAEGDFFGLAASEDGRRLIVTEVGEGGVLQEPAGSPLLFDLDAGTTRRLEMHGTRVTAWDLNKDGTVVASGDFDGIVRVGPVTGEEPHLLLGHHGMIMTVLIDPGGRWIVSLGRDKTVRLWPMPDLSEPPLHTLPRAELIAKLKTLTNIRTVRDRESSTGWKLEVGPFRGWETVPTW
jgi:WD40 repeat protein